MTFVTQSLMASLLASFKALEVIRLQIIEFHKGPDLYWQPASLKSLFGWFSSTIINKRGGVDFYAVPAIVE